MALRPVEHRGQHRQGAVGLIGRVAHGVVQARYGFAPLFVSTSTLYGLAVALTWVFFRHAEAVRKSESRVVA